MTVRRIAGILRVSAKANLTLRRRKKGRRKIRRPRSNFVPWLTRAGANQSAATRLLSRLILRATVFLWTTPRATPRASSGWAALSASAAAVLSPPAIAVSTFFTNERMRLMRAPLISARFSLRRMRFLACGVLAMSVLTSGRFWRSRNLCLNGHGNGSFPPESGALSVGGANRQANRSLLALRTEPAAAPALHDPRDDPAVLPRA